MINYIKFELKVRDNYNIYDIRITIRIFYKHLNGVDLYVTRVAPSGVFDILGQGFDKVTLVGTVLALLGGVMFVAPMVRPLLLSRPNSHSY